MHNLNIFGVEINFRECKADIKLAQVGFHLYTAHWMSPIQFTPLFELHVLSIWSALDLQREEAKQEILEGTNAKSHLFKMNQTRATLARTQCGQVFIIYKRKMLLTSRVEKADWLKLSIEIYSDANSVFFFSFLFLSDTRFQCSCNSCTTPPHRVQGSGSKQTSISKTFAGGVQKLNDADSQW